MNTIIREAREGVKNFNLAVETGVAVVIIAIAKALKTSGKFIKKHYRGIIIAIMAVVIAWMYFHPRTITEVKEVEKIVEVPVEVISEEDNTIEETTEEMTSRL